MPQTVSIIIALIGAAGTVYGIVTAAMQMRRAARKDDTAGGHTTGTICTELGYIKANTDESRPSRENSANQHRGSIPPDGGGSIRKASPSTHQWA